MSTGGEAPVVLVFRLQLFKPTETFIAAQAGALERYRPIHVGWRLGGALPDGVDAYRPNGWFSAVGLFGLGRAARLAAGLPRGGTVVHAHFAVDAVFALALARRLGAPLVATLHGFDVSRSRRSLLLSLRPALVAGVLGWPALVRRADLFLAVSAGVAAAALRRGAPAQRLRRHAIGVDLGRLAPGGGGEAGLIVMVGRLVEKKGAGLLVEAFARLAASRPQARLVLVGDGPLGKPLQRRAQRLGLVERVGFAGALPHAAALDWIRRAAVVAVPSLRARNGDAEGLPTVVLEAAALGRPIVASEAAVAGALAPGAEALVTPAGDAAALADALDRVLGDADLATRLGAAARRRVEAEFDLRARTRELERLYDGLLEAKRRA